MANAADDPEDVFCVSELSDTEVSVVLSVVLSEVVSVVLSVVSDVCSVSDVSEADSCDPAVVSSVFEDSSEESFFLLHEHEKATDITSISANKRYSLVF